MALLILKMGSFFFATTTFANSNSVQFEELIFKQQSFSDSLSEELCSQSQLSLHFKRKRNVVSGIFSESKENLINQGFRKNASSFIYKEDLAAKSFHSFEFLLQSQFFFYKNRVHHNFSRFFETLIEMEPTVRDFYAHSPDTSHSISISRGEYIQLAHLAVGIVGAETEFGFHRRYRLKKFLTNTALGRQIINSKKCAREVSRADSDVYRPGLKYFLGNPPEACKEMTDLSKGLGQIKKYPEFHQNYVEKIESENQNSTLHLDAIAVISFLVETLDWYKRILKSNCSSDSCTYKIRGQNGDELTFPYRYEDFPHALLYLYTGRAKVLLNGSATPDRLCYLRKANAFMDLVSIWTKPL